MWSKTQIKSHIEVALLLDKIKDEVFEYIGINKKVSEKQVQEFILKRFDENNIKSDKDSPIVAFNENSSKPHYFPSNNSKTLETGSLILIDLWAKFKNSDGPVADITWVAYYGNNIPKKIQNVFNVVLRARDSSLNFIKQEIKEGKMPIGKDVDKVTRDIINKEGFEGKFLHGTGHSIGTSSPHGNRSNLNIKGKKALLINLGYTIEPGIYLENEFGIRSEIDFYINEKKEVVVTTPIQNKIIKIS
jgi:Xaa-Pro aminopeptidase